MAPRGLGIRSGERLPAVEEKRDHPASPRSLSANWITEVLDLLDPTPAAEGPGCSSPVPCDGAGRFRARAALSPCVGCTNSIPPDHTARSHRPRAVEHRDCPPCGGDGGSMRQMRGGGDGWRRIPHCGFAEVLVTQVFEACPVCLDSAGFRCPPPSSSGLTRGSFFVAMAEPADGKQDPRVEPEDDFA